MPLRAAGGRQQVGHRLSRRRLLLFRHAVQVAVKTDVPRELKPLILRSERSHVLVGPHGPGAWQDKEQRYTIMST